MLRLLPFVLLPLGAGCRDALAAFGTDPAQAAAQAGDAAESFERRFTNVVRDARFAEARLALARHALTPSRLARDTSLWTATRPVGSGVTGSAGAGSGVEHELALRGAFEGNRYRFTTSAQPPAPVAVGDARHRMCLRRLDDGDWFWQTHVEQSLGTMPPARVPAVLHALLASAERPAGALRVDYRAALPRTTAALSRLATLDSIATTRLADSSTLVLLRMRIDATPIAREMPAFTRFVRKYIEPSRWRITLRDGRTEWFDVAAAQRSVTMRFRTRRGTLLPLTGTARPLPDSLQISVDALAKFGPWMVGVTRMAGTFRFIDTPTEQAWAMRFTKVPEWHLPLLGEALLRAPLRRPFERGGLVFRLGVREQAGVTVVDRDLDVALRESTVMRWLGSLGFTAMSDFQGQVEEEESRFLAELFRAMRRDLGG